MNNGSDIVNFQSARSEEFQATDWLAKLDRGDLSAGERAAFRDWLASDPYNRQEIKHAADMWYGLNAPLAHFGFLSDNYSEDNSILSLLRKSLRGWVARGRMAALAGAVGALILAGIYLAHPNAAKGFYTTEIGETRVVSLEDGSQISLNTNSILEFNFTRETRIVRLISGEAIFDVAHDERRPFIVYAADGVVRAVGTQFSVRVESEKVSVIVTEGKVAFAKRPQESSRRRSPKGALPAQIATVYLERGEAANIDRGAHEATKAVVTEHDVEERTSWTEGRLVFHDKPLQAVVDEVARYTTVHIEIANDGLKSKKITGILQIGDVNMMLEGIEGALNIKAEWISPNNVELSAG